jgi:hypothetical protein
MPFWVANILQAVLFGIYHMNPLQGIYAFFIGLFLGYVCHKGEVFSCPCAFIRSLTCGEHLLRKPLLMDPKNCFSLFSG